MDRSSRVQGFQKVSSILEGRKSSVRNMPATVIVCLSVHPPHTEARFRNLADFIFPATRTVDDAGFDDSSRTHISRSVRSCGNFDIPEYGVSSGDFDRDQILRFLPQDLLLASDSR